MKKRALSAIVATVMIIALTVVAAGIIAKFAVPFVKDGLESSTECVDYQEYFKFDESLGFNCFEPDENLILSVRASNNMGSEDKIKGFNLILFGDGFSKVISVEANAQTNDLKMYSGSTIEVPSSGETFSYNYTERATYNFAELFPVLDTGKVCERRSDRIALRRCA